LEIKALGVASRRSHEDKGTDTRVQQEGSGVGKCLAEIKIMEDTTGK
jgi:hypothetical protein